MPAIPNTYPLYLSSQDVNFGADQNTRINFGGSNTTVDLTGTTVDLSGATIDLTNTSIDTSLNALQGNVGALQGSVGTLETGLNELVSTVAALDTGNMSGLINSLNSLSETKDLSLNNFYRTPVVGTVVSPAFYTLEFIINPLLSNRYKGWDISGTNIGANTKIQDVSKNSATLIVITNSFTPPQPLPSEQVVDDGTSLTLNSLPVSISLEPKQFSIDGGESKSFNLTPEDETLVAAQEAIISANESIETVAAATDEKNSIIRAAGVAAAKKEVEKDIFVSSAGSYTLTLNIADKINMMQEYIINLYTSYYSMHPDDIAFPIPFPAGN